MDLAGTGLDQFINIIPDKTGGNAIISYSDTNGDVDFQPINWTGSAGTVTTLNGISPSFTFGGTTWQPQIAGAYGTSNFVTAAFGNYKTNTSMADYWAQGQYHEVLSWPSETGGVWTDAVSDPAEDYIFACTTNVYNGAPAVPALVAVNPDSPGTFYLSTDIFPLPGNSGGTYNENSLSMAAANVSGSSYRVCGTCWGPTWDWDVYEASFNTDSLEWPISSVSVGNAIQCTFAAIDSQNDWFVEANGTQGTGLIYKVPAGTLPGSGTNAGTNMTPTFSLDGMNGHAKYAPTQVVAAAGTGNHLFTRDSSLIGNIYAY